MKHLALSAAVLLSACTFSLFPAKAAEPIVVPREVPVSAPKDYGIKFSPPVDAPEEGRLWVCGKAAEDFLCIDFDEFMDRLAENSGTGPVTNL